MSVVATLSSGDDHLIPIGSATTVAELVDAVHAALAMPHPAQAYDVWLDGDDGDEADLGECMERALADVGIHGAEERVALRAKRVYVAREALRKAGVVTAADAGAALDVAIAEDAIKMVGLVTVSELTPLYPKIKAAVEVGKARAAEVMLDTAVARGMNWVQKARLLAAACGAGFQRVAERLVDLDAHLNVNGSLNALIHACNAGARGVAAMLLDRGADTNGRNDELQTPLQVACLRNDVALAAMLVERGANMNAKDAGGRTALLAACDGGRREVAAMLVARGADVNQTGVGGGTPLHSACVRGDLALAELLVEKGAATDVKNKYGRTPLMEACCERRGAVAAMLVGSGADPNIRDMRGRTPLSVACGHGDAKLAAMLLRGEA